ncbi:hypothetical protein [Blastochloris sulfoviridis]|uniref:Uncharacterized protein n=1 Tax=Blastochloris sulfoviridis TaxID=50712 RepID=A0A5M6I3G7_9HYPH|nr:hypothetical protein [Blastochloris sulfoviridis]KAA5602407.1 hypothetical protein F1193_05780 [Blastochloris sulfoviridis]
MEPGIRKQLHALSRAGKLGRRVNADPVVLSDGDRGARDKAADRRPEQSPPAETAAGAERPEPLPRRHPVCV